MDRQVSQLWAVPAVRAIAAERRAFARATAIGQPRAAVLDIADGCAIYTGDGLFSNRGFGFGLTGELSADDLDRVERFYDERGAPTEIEVASMADAALLHLLARRGYELRRFRNVFARSPDAPVPDPASGIGIATVDTTPTPAPGRATPQAWSETLIEGFGYDRADDVRRVQEWNAALLTVPGMTALVASIDGRPAGSASVLVDGSAAVLGGAATRPDDRRRGVQSGLIAARLALGRLAGCELAVVTADPGGSSARNAERAGFRLVCTLAVMRRPDRERPQRSFGPSPPAAARRG
ncbi:MAG: GNAT family N-acetyltransferase [Acidimicrobiales bacterium]